MNAGDAGLRVEGPRAGPLTVAAGAWIGGLLCGRWAGGWGLWFILTAVAAALAVVALRLRRRAVGVGGLLLSLAGAAACWFMTCTQHVAGNDVAHWVRGEHSQLADVIGVVEGPAYLSSPHRGAMGEFAFADPTTLLILKVESMVVEGQLRSASGRLLLGIEEAEHRIGGGDRVRCLGWLGTIDGPSNPGEYDYAAMARRQGIAGRLSLPSRGNWTLLQPAASLDSDMLRRLRERIAAACSWSLSLGMAEPPRDEHLPLLHALLLGQRQSLPRELTEAFRDVGLSHILSISGAHLGILVGLVWAVARLLLPTPSRSAMVAGVVLLLYLSAIPLETPIVRSAIMAGLYALAFSTGWRVRPLEPLAAATLVVLIWRPGDLFDAGFQLSYGVVLAMILFTPRVQAWVTPRYVGDADPYMPGVVVARWVLGCVAVSLVAFITALPLVAYHFRVISPWAVVLSVLSLPVISGVLAAGYLKIVAGLMMPSLGLVLAGPLGWLTDATAALVEQARHWPGATVKLAEAPSAAWVIAMLATAAAAMAGQLRQRRLPLAGLVVICSTWLIYPAARGPSSLTRAQPHDTALLLNMFAVGDGSCFLARFAGHTLMFDCGSQAYLDVGSKSIAPALQRLGVTRIDTLLLSHADMDHLCGVLDVVASLPGGVARVLVPPQLLREAGDRPDGPSAYLVGQLRAMGVEPDAVHAGWRETHGGTRLQLHWPPPDYRGPRRNDESLVLSIDVAGRRVLFTGDIAADAMTRLREAGVDLRADVIELPHHGSYVAGVSPQWLASVRPLVALQSSGVARLRNDRWAEDLEALGVTRLATPNTNMVELAVLRDGTITWSSMKGVAGRITGWPDRAHRSARPATPASAAR